MSTHGKCHCGQIEWDVTLEEKAHILCHCDTCKQLTGSPYTLNQIIPADNLKITKGKEGIKTYTYYGDSGKPVHCYYCGNCTSHIYHHQTVAADKYVVHTLLLDGAKSFKPSAEIFGKARLAWVPEVATTFDTLPPQ